MPVVLGLERARAWLTKGGRPEVEPIELVATEVSSRVNLVANDDARLLDPATTGAQLRLLCSAGDRQTGQGGQCLKEDATMTLVLRQISVSVRIAPRYATDE